MANRSLHPLLHYLRRLGGSAGEGAEDTHLLQRFLTGRDESAFRMLVQRYGGMVWGLCVRRLGETPEAEDAFQATFLVLVRKAASLRGSQSLGPWLHGVAHRTTLKLRGRRARQSARESPLPEQLADRTPEATWSELRPLLDDEIQRLPTKYRQPVLLCYLQGLSCEEAALRLGCAKGTIFSRLSRGRELLRGRLARRGLDVSAGVLAVVLAENAAVRAMPPASLLETTIRTALLLATGAAPPALSAPLVALVEGVIRSMFLSKMKLTLIVVLVLGLAGSGAGLLGHRSNAEPPAPRKDAKPPAPPAATADAKPQKKAAESKAHVPPPDFPAEKERLREWCERLMQPVDFVGIEDPRTTLNDALDSLSKRYNLVIRVNKRAFRLANFPDVGQTLVARPPIPPMHASLRTVLQTILECVEPEHSQGAVLVLRKDHIEITTDTFLRMELNYRNRRSIPPLVWGSFEETPLGWILPRLAEISGYNVVADPKAGEKLQTKLSVTLNNVPIDTAVRLVANMAGLTVVRLDNVFYVTTAENAKKLREEQDKLNAGEE